ncbi:hypothetical protein [Roseibium algae]|uniref:Secreted protein n=1 Tax=Roseibium algae TaxID=3123038 RepID=A0ABU8TIM4_9HYPH
MMAGNIARSAFRAAVFSFSAIITTASLAETTSASIPAPSSELLQSIQTLDRAWDASDLGFTNATFAVSPATGYGQYQKRPSNVFTADDTLTIYAEPVGYGFEKTENGYRHDLEVSYSLLNMTGQVLATQSSFTRFSGEAQDRKRELPTNLSFQFQGLPTGHYVIEAAYADKLSAKTATLSLPFAIEAAE